MPTPILIEVGNIKLNAELSNSPTAKAIAKALPIETDFRTRTPNIFCIKRSWGPGR